MPADIAQGPYGAMRSSAKALLERALAGLGYSAEGLESSITMPKGFADLSSSIAFPLAKTLKKSPMAIAEEIAGAINGSMADRIRASGIRSVAADRGYVNFVADRTAFASSVLSYAGGISAQGGAIKAVSDAGRDADGKARKVIIEYPSVNPNKPWHLGHLKNAVLGDCIANIHEACGFRVEREDFIEDLGSQIVESVWGFLNMANDPKDRKFDQWLGEEYVKVNKHMEANDIKADLSRLLQLMEQHGTKEAKLARDIAERCVMAQNETAAGYRIFRDVLVWETDIIAAKLLQDAMDALVKAGGAERKEDGKYAGCTIMDLDRVKDLPEEFKGLKEKVKVLVRNDGTPTYVAKDIAFHMWKFGLLGERFRFRKFIERQGNGKALYTTAQEGEPMPFGGVDRAINIIDARQDYPQSLLRLAFRLMGRDDVADGIRHLSYGPLELESGVTLSGRKGTWIGSSADDLLRRTIEAASEKVAGGKAEIGKEEREEIARKVAIAAIKFDLLKLSPEKKTLFSWERALSFEGNSGPYCQYMYARTMRILEAAGASAMAAPGDEEVGALAGEKEFALLKRIALLPDIVEKACNELRPSVLTEYANTLAMEFSSFYESSPILKAEKEEDRKARLALAGAFAESMGYLLSLLGIQTVNRM